MKKLLTACLLLITAQLLVHGQDPSLKLNAENIKEVVAAMTLEEKSKLVVGTGMRFPGAAVVGETQNKVPGAAGNTFAIPRLGIPSIVLADGPAGLRISPVRDSASGKTYYCTAFPVGTLLASTWDNELVEQVGRSIGNELLEYGVDILLAPALNIHRNPLCGRNFEYYSEDPLVSGKMAAAIVKGVQYNGVGTSLKHYAANNTETNRTALNTIVTERTLREIYLRGFEIAVKESDPWTVMSSYNLINGTHASESYDLLTSILREEWGFWGFVMTDWFGGTDPVAQMKAGNDLLMPGRPVQADTIKKVVENGALDETVLDLNVDRILRIIVKTPTFKGYNHSDNPDLKLHAQLARKAGAEGMVLLKNNQGILPLPGNTGQLALFGNTSYEIITGGTGSGDVNEAYSVSLREGLNNVGFSIDPELAKIYLAYMEEVKAIRPPRRMRFMPEEPVPEMEIDRSFISKAAGQADLALITIGRNSGEFRDRTLEDFYLSDTEKSLIETVSEVFHAMGKKVVVILNTGGVIETASWRGRPDAILLAWQAGQETGNAIADVLTGKVNPSGKLATTFPVKYEDVPSSTTFPGIELPVEEPEEEGGRRRFMRAKPSVITYEDDIYVGYRYYDAAGVEPAYEFGFGLSYTTFEYGRLKLDSKKFKGWIQAEVEVTNSGSKAGREVVQLYLSAPETGLNKPVRELKAFAKTRLLKPGESQTISFTIDHISLCSFDPDLSHWNAEPGIYKLALGASSRDIRKEVDFKLDYIIITEAVSRSLVPQEDFETIVPHTAGDK